MKKLILFVLLAIFFSAAITKANVSLDNLNNDKYLFSTANDGQVIFWDLENGKQIVLERIGLADPELIKAYREAYCKRLEKVKFNPAWFKEDFYMPEIEIENKDELNNSETDLRSVKLSISAKDEKENNLDRINVFVNGVPIYGTNGIDLRDRHIKTFRDKKDSYSYKPTDPIVKLKDATLTEGKMDSLKTEIAQKDGEIQIIRDGIVVAKMEKGDNSTVKIFMPDNTVAPKQAPKTITDNQFKIITGDLYYGTVLDSAGYHIGPYGLLPYSTHAAYRDTTKTFVNGVLADTVKCHWPAGHTYANNDRLIFVKYYIDNAPGLFEYGEEAAKQHIKTVVGVSNSSILIDYNNPLSGYGDITKWVVTYSYYVDQNGNTNFQNALPKTIRAKGIYNEDTAPGSDPERTTSYVFSIASLYNIQGNTVCTYYTTTIGWFNGNVAPTYQALTASTTVGINPINTQVPVNYTLSQNYPNPFNSSTKIKFDVVKPGNVSIKVYSMVGKEIGSIVDKKMQPGTYEATWNANVSSGVYFYTMAAGSFTQTKKMVVIK